jgi:hypothetical protein
MSNTRIYITQLKGSKPRLIDAGTGAQAIRHVAKGLITARVASAKETAILMKDGTELEVAGEVDDQAEAE